MGSLVRDRPATQAPASEPLLSAQSASVTRGSTTTLHDFDLSVASGDVVGLVGPNGSGKTTSLLLLAGLLPTAQGSVAILGQSAHAEARRRIGYLPDEAALYDELTGLENLSLFAHVKNTRVRDDLAIALGLTRAELLARAGTYSFGMRRKIAIAQTLTGQPALLLLDEPTIGLDPAGREQLAAALRDFALGGAAVVLASNDLAFVEEHCQRVLFLSAGRIVLDGSPQALLAPLRSRIHFDITLDGPYRDVQGPSFQFEQADGHRVRFSSGHGSAALPALVQALLDAGNDIETIEIARASLVDVFRVMTKNTWNVETSSR